MKRKGKIINFILVSAIIFLLVGMTFATAAENTVDNQSGSQEQPITGLEHSVEKYYVVSSSDEETTDGENVEETENNSSFNCRFRKN